MKITKTILIAGVLVVGVFFGGSNSKAAVLGVTQITAIQTYASADNTFDNGWKWVFDITVPTNETILNMKFADWTNGSSTIPAAGNIQFFSTQSSNAFDESGAITIGASGVYSSAMKIKTSDDLDITKAGRQIQITVEARVPVGSSGGSYSTSYGVKSNPDPNVPIITIDVYNTTPTNSDVVVTASTSVGTLNETSHTFTVNGSFDFIATGPAGDVTTKTVTITNIDKIAPVIAFHNNISTYSSSAGTIVNYTSPSTTDNVDPLGTASCSPVSGSTFVLGNTTVTCNATDTAGNLAIPTIFTIAVTGPGSMSIQVDGDTPVSALVSANTSDNAMTRLSFTTNNEAFNITRLTIANIGSASSSRSVDSVRVFDGNGTLFCSGALDSSNHLRCANDAGLFTVNGNSTITIKANIAQVGSGSSATYGDAPKLALFADTTSATYTDDIKAVGISSGTALSNADIGGSLTLTTTLVGAVGLPGSACGIVGTDCIGGNTQVIRKTVPTFATVYSSTNLYTGLNTIYQFSVTAGENANVAIHRFALNSSVLGGAIGAVDTLALYENGSLVDTSKYTITNTGAGADLKTAGQKVGAVDNGIVVTFAGEDKIGLNSTKTFAIKANVTLAATPASISTYMVSDITPAAGTVTGTIHDIIANAGPITHNMIWSDNSAAVHSTGTTAYTDVGNDSSTDWTNGYLVQTLPSIPQSLMKELIYE